jgi:CRP-like cAMP-binding protein
MCSREPVKSWTVADAGAFLGEQGWFAGQPQWFQNAVLDRASIRAFEPGSVICRPGEPAIGVFGVLEGQVNFVWPAPDGQEVFYNFVPPRGFFGHGSCLDGHVHLMNAVAPRATRTLYLSVDAFEDLGRAHPESFRCWATQVTEMYRGMFQTFIDAKAFEARQRVHRSLQALAQRAGEETPDGVELNVRLTQSEFASYVGVTRQYVSRFIGELRDMGILEWGGNRIVVRDTEALQALTRFEPTPGQVAAGALSAP